MIRRRKCKRYETITIKDVSGGNYANEGYEGRKEGRKEEGRKGAVVARVPVAPPIGAPPRGGEYI